MGKILVVAEKPSVGRDIAKVLKCTQKGDGFLASDNYIVSWAIGHLVTLCEPEDYDAKYKSWKKETLPIIPAAIKLKPVDKTKKQLNILKKLFIDKGVESVICATDSGREGELIFRYIYDIVKSKKPFQRLWISSMTDAAIKEGFETLKPGTEYDLLYASAKCRSEADWLVGINATRAYTIAYHALLSIGRVQTPTLAIIVERQKEINTFVPADYWEVNGLFGGYKGLWFDQKTKESKLSDQKAAEAIADKTTGKVGVIFSIETEEKKQPPNLLYDLTELQRDCNKRFGFSAQKTLELAQILYEKRKLITYPRTDSRYLSDDMIPKLTVILQKLAASPYADQAAYVLALSALPLSKRIVDSTKVTDHHAIIPTEASVNLKSLANDEFKVYDLVVRRFLSVFYPNYIYNVTKIITDVENEHFLTKGTTIIQLGWMAFYKDDHTNAKKGGDETGILPNVAKGDNVTLQEAVVLHKKTTPPKAYTEASLLSAMENAGRFVDDETLKEQLKDSGLGTPATRAAIIERLLQVGYIERKGKTLAPTEKGMLLITVVPPEMKSPETTGRWEKGLASISKGRMDEKKFMDSIAKYVHYLVESAKTASADIKFPEETRRGRNVRTARPSFGKCPKCGKGDIMENSKAFFCSEWQSGCKVTFWKDRLGTYNDRELPPALLKKFESQRQNPVAQPEKTHETEA